MAWNLIRRRLVALSHRNQRLFFIGEATSMLGSSMSSLAVTFAVLGGGGTRSDLGYVMAARIVPMVVLLTYGGVIADRLGPRRVMLASDVLRCLTQAVLGGLLLLGHPPIWAFVALVAVWGIGEAFYMPARGALIPRVAAGGASYEGGLRDANALAGLAQSMASVGGPALAGLAVAVVGPGVVVALDSGTYAVSVVALALLRVSDHVPRRGRRGFPGRSGVREWAGLREEAGTSGTGMRGDTGTNEGAAMREGMRPETGTGEGAGMREG
ncbi:MFS transporter [Sphaerisporangium perillae]|uniref:MFS transporter n=1 Tax=Sphaerisporangium perillae TaxID=2935860 RepID=UPI00200F1762|nr:MFS transporter [Sphaerisporangium perillae]